MYTIYHSHYKGTSPRIQINYICKSPDSNGTDRDIQLVFKNNSADVAGSALYHMMSNSYDSTGG